MKLNVVHLCSSVNAKTIDLALLKATAHTSHKPPSDKYVTFLQSTVDTCYGPDTVVTIVQRLRLTTDVCVAAKCLILLHKMIKSEYEYKGEDSFRDDNGHRNLIYDQGGSNLKLNDLNVNSRFTRELSPWVQCGRPEIPKSKLNKIVVEMKELMIQDCFSVMRLIKIRFEEINARMAKSNELIPVLARLEKCKEGFSEFSWRSKYLVEGFWSLVSKLTNGQRQMLK
ncbi:unnamed protein product [Arabis nemorensis]|uniref:ENTH domain-containing protein n=1 Tax=Arabis nemorensis TaxID=586526 RepID=A0A565CX04_9BRAS|nr:unnamed protein product [Arabis nemorensis]